MRTRNAGKERLVKRKAIEMIVKEGFQGFSMNKLARASGISVATLYIYYRDKDDLIQKIGTGIAKQFMSRTLDAFSSNMRFADGLKKQWANRANFALKYPKEVACLEIIKHSRHVDHIVEDSLKEFRMAMEEFTRNAIKNKELRTIPVDVFWSIAYGPLYTLLRFHEEGKSIGGRKFKLTKKTMDDALEIVVRALKP